jgi:hypothetical protein
MSAARVSAVHVTDVVGADGDPGITCMICGSVVFSKHPHVQLFQRQGFAISVLFTSCAVADSQLPSITKQQPDRLSLCHTLL